MNTKAVAIFVLAILALSIFAMIPILPVKALPTLTLSDTELLNEFIWKFDTGSSLTGKTDVAGPGVQFDLAGLGKAGICDDHPVSSSAGGAIYYGHNSDFTGFGKYRMRCKNLGSGSIDVDLFMNTGFTLNGGWPHSRDWHWDTFWKGTPVTLGAGESTILTLDFSSSYQAWNIADDPMVHGHTDGESGTAIWRLNETTCIGFEVVGSGTASVLLSGINSSVDLYIDPPVTNKAPGDINSFFDVFVTLENFTDLAGFEIKLTWNNSQIIKDTVDYATYLDLLWGSGKWNMVLEGSGVGYYRLAAAALATSASNAGASVLFKVHFKIVKTCNFALSTSIHFDIAKLSDSNADPITATLTDGMYYMSSTKPDLELIVHDPDPSKPFEICKTFEVEVWVTDICANLKDYNIIILYDSTYLEFVDVDYWGVLGGLADNAHVELLAPGRVHVWDTGGLIFNSGDGLLFALTFHIDFDDRIEHIWRKNHHADLTAQVSFEDATLSFEEGIIPMGGIIMPPPLAIVIHLIRGDVNCDGMVTIADIATVAFYYDQTSPTKYDLTEDGTIDIYDIVTASTNYGYGV